MKHEVKIGQTDYTVLVYIPDPASTDGSGKTGLVAADLTVSGVRVETDNDVTVTDYTSALNNLSALTDAHTDWGLKEVSSSLAPGLYRLDIADALYATGAWSSVVYVMITSSAAAASPMEFVLVPEAPVSGGSLSTTERAAAADAILDRDMATGTDSGSSSVRTVRSALRPLRNKWTNAAGTYTSYKENDTTVNFTSTLTTDPAGEAITASDPA